MPKVMINGREVFLPDEVISGQEIKTQGAIPANRTLILQRPEGNMLVPNEQDIRIVTDDRFIDAPTFQYG